jgi:hypothetical protein
MENNRSPDELSKILSDTYRRALKVLRDEDSAQDFVIEIWNDLAKDKNIRHLGGYIRLRLRKAIARKYKTQSRETLACELSNHAEGDALFIEQDERLAMLATNHISEDSTALDMETLSPFQTEIVYMLERGYSAPGIASVFDVYPRTIYQQIKIMKDGNLNGSFGPTQYRSVNNGTPQLPRPITHPIKNRYVYAYISQDGTPYYIGKGTIRRVYSDAHTVRLPQDPRRIHILAKEMSDPDARQVEMLFIYLYGRRDNNTGPLYNRTDGADGPAYNTRLSQLKDDEFYADNPNFMLIEGDRYWYCESFPNTATKPKEKQMNLKFPPPVDPYYLKRMAEREEGKRKMQDALEGIKAAIDSGDFCAELKHRNEFDLAKYQAAA